MSRFNTRAVRNRSGAFVDYHLEDPRSGRRAGIAGGAERTRELKGSAQLIFQRRILLPSGTYATVRSLVVGERGQIAFYAAIIVPIVLSISILAVDVSQWQRLRSETQSQADRLALGAARLLPDQNAAAAFIQAGLLEHPKLQAGTPDAVSITSSEVQITLSAAHESVFDAFLPNRGESQGVLLKVIESATAQVVPTDMALILSDSIRLRPAAYQSWGALADWPEASYFNFVSLPCDRAHSESENFALGSVCAKGREQEYQRWATQACFNPGNLPFKRAALAILDAAAPLGNDRVAVSFSPGDEPRSNYTQAQTLAFEGKSKPQWSNWFDQENFISDEACAYFADPEISPGTPYELFGPSAQLNPAVAGQETECAKFVPGFPSGQHLPLGKLSSCFTNGQLSTRETIYLHAVRDREHRPGAADLVEAARAAMLELVNATDAREIRKNLAAQQHRKIVMLTEEVPEPDAAFQALAGQLEVNGISLYIVSYVYTEMERASSLMARNRANAEAIAALENRRVAVLIAEEESQLTRIASRLAAVDREVALKL